MKDKQPTAAEMLNWMIERTSHPYSMWMEGIPSSGRCKGSEWVLSYEPKYPHSGPNIFAGCVYAPTAIAVIAKAMRLFATQKKAAQMLKDAVA